MAITLNHEEVQVPRPCQRYKIPRIETSSINRPVTCTGHAGCGSLPGQVTAQKLSAEHTRSISGGISVFLLILITKPAGQKLFPDVDRCYPTQTDRS